MNPLNAAAGIISDPSVNPAADPRTWPGIQQFFGIDQIRPLINKIYGMPMPGTTPGIDMAQQLMRDYQDSSAAASTIGVKSQKAQKIKKTKGGI